MLSKSLTSRQCVCCLSAFAMSLCVKSMRLLFISVWLPKLLSFLIRIINKCTYVAKDSSAQWYSYSYYPWFSKMFKSYKLPSIQSVEETQVQMTADNNTCVKVDNCRVISEYFNYECTHT